MKRLRYKGPVPSFVGAPLALPSLLAWGRGSSFLDKKRWPCGEAHVSALGNGSWGGRPANSDVSLESDPPAPCQALSDDCHQGQHLDCNLVKNLESEPPREATSRFPPHRRCELMFVTPSC